MERAVVSSPVKTSGLPDSCRREERTRRSPQPVIWWEAPESRIQSVVIERLLWEGVEVPSITNRQASWKRKSWTGPKSFSTVEEPFPRLYKAIRACQGPSNILFAINNCKSYATPFWFSGITTPTYSDAQGEELMKGYLKGHFVVGCDAPTSNLRENFILPACYAHRPMRSTNLLRQFRILHFNYLSRTCLLHLGSGSSATSPSFRISKHTFQIWSLRLSLFCPIPYSYQARQLRCPYIISKHFLLLKPTWLTRHLSLCGLWISFCLFFLAINIAATRAFNYLLHRFSIHDCSVWDHQ